MSYLDLHIKTLQVAVDAIALGASIKTVSLVTGLTPPRVERLFRSLGTVPGTGRPANSTIWYHKANLATQAEGSVFAARYARLRRFDAAPPDALIQAFHHYRSVHGATPRLNFDRAFYIAAQLEGRWNATTKCLDVLACTACGCEFLAAWGTRTCEGCPFCKLLRRACEPNCPFEAKLSGASPAVPGPPTTDDLRSLQLARACAALGARLRTVAALTGLPGHELGRILFGGQHEAAGIGRAPASAQWYRWAKLRHQAAGSAFASRFVRLVGDGIEAADALLAAYRVCSQIPRPSARLSFDRAFDLAARLCGKWIAPRRELRVLNCPDCGCDHVASTDVRLPAPCPFCKLARKPAGAGAAMGFPVKSDHAPRPRLRARPTKRCVSPSPANPRTGRLPPLSPPV